MRPIQWHLKNNWRVPESLEKVIPIPGSLLPHLRWWLGESNVLTGQPLHPLKLERTARGTWSLPESKLHINHLELKAVFLALKEFQDLCSNNIDLVATDNTTLLAYINKEGGMKSGSLCALLWRILSWCTRKQVTSQGTSHPRPAERDSRQAIQTWPDHSNRVVPSSRGIPSYMLPVAQSPSGLVCQQIQQQASTVCVNGSKPTGLGSGCTQSVLGKSGPICLSTSSHLGQSGGEVTRLPLQQDHSDCTWMAQHTLVLGSSGNV